jgi:hypothetical protein
VGRFDRVLEAAECIGPELGEQVSDRFERLREKRVEAAGSVTALAEQACLFEHGDVQTDCLLGEGETGGDLARRQLAMLNDPQDLSAVRIGKGP